MVSESECIDFLESRIKEKKAKFVALAAAKGDNRAEMASILADSAILKGAVKVLDGSSPNVVSEKELRRVLDEQKAEKKI